MKRILVAIILAIVSTLPVSAQTINKSAEQNSKAEQKVQKSSNGTIEQLFAAWNSHDVDKAVASFSEDAVYEDVTAGHISRGRAEVRKWVEGAFDVVENFKIEVVSSSFHNGRGVAEWVWSGTNKGLLKTGRKFSVRGVSVFEVRRGKISHYKEFYDFATVMRQVGLLPDRKD